MQLEDELRDGRRRVVIERVEPEVDGGRFPAKRIEGDVVTVEADAFTDGHDLISAIVLFRRSGDQQWSAAPMSPLVNDRWRGSFTVENVGRYEFTVEAWIDHFRTWRRDTQKRADAGQDLGVWVQVGLNFLRSALERMSEEHRALAEKRIDAVEAAADAQAGAVLLLDEEILLLMNRYPDRTLASRYEHVLPIDVDRERARFSSWYEVFPRSLGGSSDTHGTFKSAEEFLPYVAAMGFDVLYLPPIHPIGETNRKGRNNSLAASPEDPGSPWAIGASSGGHKSLHPELGTLDDFRSFRQRAWALGIELALDVAFQASPDHPLVKEHPEWFRQLPDGTIQFAENPPKKYQDIYPFDFESDDWKGLWEELASVFFFWIGEGVRIFRVDNPHTKPLPFWEWVIARVKSEHPDVIFLAEAFTRPKIMYRLAKGGFSQSYTYFTWRNTKWEIEKYFHELTQTKVREFFRPNLWPNTPDILPEYLQYGGRGAFMARLILAATLSSNYGIYGPAFELMEHDAREHGSEEYLDSEKYEIRHRDLRGRESLFEFIARVNQIRRENPALQTNDTLRFHPTDNEQIICYSKATDDLQNVIICAVNLDPHNTHTAAITLPREELGIGPHEPVQLHELLGGGRFVWHGPHNQVTLNPGVVPARIFRLRKRVRTEQDFEYYF